MKTKPLALILGAVIAAGMLAHGAYDFVFTDDGIAYFSGDWRRLLYPVVIAVVVGLVVWGIYRLPQKASRKARLLALGTVGCALMGGIAWLGWSAPPLFAASPAHYSQREMLENLALGVVGALVASVIVWWEFYQTWRKT